MPTYMKKIKDTTNNNNAYIISTYNNRENQKELKAEINK